MATWFHPESWLYRKRYIIGYIVITIGFAFLLYFAGTTVPGGLTNAEEQAFIKSSALDLQNVDTLTTVSLPFYVAQRTALEFFGPSVLSIKLWGLIFALITGVGAVLLLRRWFRPNIALLATVIMITTGQFIYVAQSGTPSITYIMWPVWLLLTATMITTSEKHRRFWKILFFIIAPLSLYTPLNIYLVVAIMSAGLIHPHVRYVLRKMSRPHLALFLLMSLAIAAPLGYLVIREPSLALQLLGAPSTWPPDIAANAKSLLQQYFNFMQPHSTSLMTPVLGLGSMAVIALGVWRLIKIRYTARSYTLVTWLILLIPVLLINPTYTSAAFVPLLILLAMGLEFILRSWYGIFPRNPYARFVGMVPLVILVGGLVISGLSRYFSGYQYDPVTASYFSHDLTLLDTKVRTGGTVTLVVDKSEYAFYTSVAQVGKQTGDKLVVITTMPANAEGRLAATHAAHGRVGYPIDQIITTGRSNDADRFYIYTTK